MDDSVPENITPADRQNAAVQQNILKKDEAKQAFSAQ
jgi:hypothetical protein